MKMKSALLGAAIAASCVVLPAIAFASTCQVYSSKWLTRKYCGDTTWGWGEGILYSGAKALRAQKLSDAVTSVGVRGIDSNGRSIDSCATIDYVNDNNGSYVIGGACEYGVRFGLQINH